MQKTSSEWVHSLFQWFLINTPQVNYLSNEQVNNSSLGLQLQDDKQVPPEPEPQPPRGKHIHFGIYKVHKHKLWII